MTSAEEMSLLWLPGWGSHHRVWDEVEAGRGVHSCFPSFQDVTAVGDFIPAICTAAPSGPLVVVGWSLGASLAIELISQRALDIRAAVLLSATPEFCSDDPALGWPARVVARMQRRLQREPEATMCDFYQRMFTEAEAAAGGYRHFVDTVCAGDVRSGTVFSEAALVAGLAYLADRVLWHALPTLSVPTIWIHGDADSICPIRRLEAVREQLDGTAHHHFVTVPAGHALPVTAADACRDGVTQALTAARQSN